MPFPAYTFPRRLRPLGAAVVVAVIATLAIFSIPTQASTPAKASRAKVVITKISSNGAKVTVSGKATLPSTLKNTAKNRKKIKVTLTLKNAAGKSETFTATPNAKLKFTATKTTKLTGRLSLSAQVKVGGKKSGPVATNKNALTITAKSGDTTPGTATRPTSTTTTTTSTTTTPTNPSGPADLTPVPDGSEKLVGLFELNKGVQAISGAFSGTYFRMLGGPLADSPVYNGQSTALDKTYTLLRPGTDGGLRTDVYQPAPSPAFAGTIDGQPTGDALANRIVQPQKFFGIDFTIVTGPVDAQTGEADPLPAIINTDGKLSGQISAWVAQWNGLSFSQGSPKPNGTLPGASLPVTGTYDAATKHFVLQWQALIIGGPFGGFNGNWHLEGTFVPASA